MIVCHRPPGRGRFRGKHCPGSPLALAEPAGGFVLPLAISACLVALLGSLSVQSAVLQNHWLQVSRQGLRQQEDALASAAQQLVGRINRLHPCLLALPLEQWSLAHSHCPAPFPLEPLIEGDDPRGHWRLLSWQPGRASETDSSASETNSSATATVTATALLELTPSAGAMAPRRARFTVLLAGEPLRAQGVRLVALRGGER